MRVVSGLINMKGVRMKRRDFLAKCAAGATVAVVGIPVVGAIPKSQPQPDFELGMIVCFASLKFLPIEHCEKQATRLQQIARGLERKSTGIATVTAEAECFIPWNESVTRSPLGDIIKIVRRCGEPKRITVRFSDEKLELYESVRAILSQWLTVRYQS